jgi:hypothetical protein
MAKFKAPKAKKSEAKSNLRALPCLLLVMMIFGLLMLLLYWAMKSST